MESSAATAAQTVNETDFSLRSSGRTYLDQKGETDRIVDRIKTSSASVIGIAGVRGAGKSSLAKKVLDKCDAAGFFTLLIPSPTGYEPREFLLAIFQRIAEHASDRIQTVTQGAENLASLGRGAAFVTTRPDCSGDGGFGNRRGIAPPIARGPFAAGPVEPAR